MLVLRLQPLSYNCSVQLYNYTLHTDNSLCWMQLEIKSDATKTAMGCGASSSSPPRVESAAGDTRSVAPDDGHQSTRTPDGSPPADIQRTRRSSSPRATMTLKRRSMATIAQGGQLQAGEIIALVDAMTVIASTGAADNARPIRLHAKIPQTWGSTQGLRYSLRARSWLASASPRNVSLVASSCKVRPTRAAILPAWHNTEAG